MVVTKRKTVFSLNPTDLVLGTSTAIFLLCSLNWAVDCSGRDVVHPLSRLSLLFVALIIGTCLESEVVPCNNLRFGHFNRIETRIEFTHSHLCDYIQLDPFDFPRRDVLLLLSLRPE